MHNYQSRKTSGLLELTREEATTEDGLVVTHIVVSKRFSRETGIEEGTEERQVSIAELEKHKAYLLEEIADIDALIADIHKMEGTK